jgi:hypothetical protein
LETGYKYFGYFFLLFVLFVALGFYYPYFSLFPEFPSVTRIVHIHAIALLLWVVIIIVQPLLITYKKYKTHRLVGKLTYFLMPVIIISSVGVLRQQYEEGIDQKLTPLVSFKTLYTSAAGLICILIFYSLAIYNIVKGNVVTHMRYMISLALLFIPPSFGRTLGYWLDMKQFYTYNISIALCMAILVTLIVYDWKKNLNFRPYIIALSIFSIVHVGWYIIGHPI